MFFQRFSHYSESSIGFGRDVSVDPEESEPGICFLALEMTNW